MAVEKKPYDVERELITKTIEPSGNATKAVIVGIADGAIRANFPPDFIPPKQGIDDIVKAYDGDVSGVAERGIDYGNGIPIQTPAKIYEKRMFGNDAMGGGSVIFKSKECLLIVIFDKNPAQANRMTTNAGEHLEESGL